MVGIKGRSGGKALTPEDKAKKMAAAAARVAQDLPPPDPAHADADDPVLRLGKPLTWGDELKRQQVEGERIQNRRRHVEVDRAAVELARAQDERDEARGKLVLKTDRDKALADLAAVMVADLSILVDAGVALVPVEHRPQARHLMDKAVAQYRQVIADRLKPRA